jgi:DNA invertase Pin-like site-specific DNA recombinase
MSDSKRLRTRLTRECKAKTDAVYARTAADDEAGTARRDQVRRVLEGLGTPARAAVYGDPGRSGLDADRPALRRLMAEVRRRGLRRVVVRDLTHLARSAALLETILGELRTAGVQLVTAGRADWRA